MPIIRQKEKGFTLIELLIVIAIIAILTGVILASLSGAKSKSRDAKRVADIGQLQLAMEQFFDRCQEYPSSLSLAATCTSDASIILGNYISVIPTAPLGTTAYNYAVRNDLLDYVLYAKFERDNEALRDALNAFPAGTYNPTFTCNKAIFEYCMAPK